MALRKSFTVIKMLLLGGIVSVFYSCEPSSTETHTTWTHYGGSPDQSKYFNASQITKENVDQLELVWNYPTGEGFYNFSPIIVDTVMYVYGKNYSLIALNAVTGKELKKLSIAVLKLWK